MSENGFFIIHVASFFISNVKGADIALKILENNILKEKMYKPWEYILVNDDRIYEIIGILKILPDFILDMKVVCKNPTVKMCFSDFEYIDTYAELNKRIVELNGNYHHLQNKKAIGKLFDLNFINNHSIESIDMDYGETILKLN